MTHSQDRTDGLHHLAPDGSARMVDVGAKTASQRQAAAEGAVYLSAETLEAVRQAGTGKGDVFSIAELAGIMGAKRTGDLIPLCHPLGLDSVAVRLALADKLGAVLIRADARTTAQTGVEMEALTAVSVAALTVYDMVKARERGATIGDVALIEKSGGKSGHWRAEGPLSAAYFGSQA